MIDPSVTTGHLILLFALIIGVFSLAMYLYPRVDAISSKTENRIKTIWRTMIVLRIKRFLNTLNESQLRFFSILTGWSIINLIFYFYAAPEYYSNPKRLWPIDSGSMLYKDYDSLEFFLYCILPWLVFAIHYSLLSARKKD